MRVLRVLILQVLVAVAHADGVKVTVLASIDADRVAATGLKVEQKRDMPDFTVTYLRGPEPTDVIGFYEGGHPATFSSRGKLLSSVKTGVNELPADWVCWSEEQSGVTLFGSETLINSRRTVVEDTKTEVCDQIHVFVIRRDLESLSQARKLALSLIKSVSGQQSQLAQNSQSHELFSAHCEYALSRKPNPEWLITEQENNVLVRYSNRAGRISSATLTGTSADSIRDQISKLRFTQKDADMLRSLSVTLSPKNGREATVILRPFDGVTYYFSFTSAKGTQTAWIDNPDFDLEHHDHVEACERLKVMLRFLDVVRNQVRAEE